MFLANFPFKTACLLWVGAKKNAAHFCTAFGFPVYNLMKSFNVVLNDSAAFFSIAAVCFH